MQLKQLMKILKLFVENVALNEISRNKDRNALKGRGSLQRFLLNLLRQTHLIKLAKGQLTLDSVASNFFFANSIGIVSVVIDGKVIVFLWLI